jgi:DNA-binding NtrC family response regulator
MSPRNVLIVEDDDNSSELLSAIVESEGFVACVARTLAEARQLLVVHRPAIVILDLGLPDGSGMDLFADRELRGDAEIVLITGNASVETSIQALRLGAADYLVKPISLKLLRSVLTRLVEQRPVQAAVSVEAGTAGTAVTAVTLPAMQRRGDRSGGAATDSEDDRRFSGMWGQSAGMRAVFQQIERVARTSISVFIVGESGTGKELVAESIHRLSHRRSGPFEAVNCGAVSAQLIESELFGHEKGSFTGAIKQHRGFFERASGGTLFLDEVTEMPLDLQVKLLRVLETGTFSRVGSDQLLHSDVRLVAATNRQPLEAVRDGKLRGDLYYRLNVFQIALPPLRDRMEDLPLIARHFLAGFAAAESRTLSFADSAITRMRSWHWPGNVRELRNYVQRIAVMADSPVIDAGMLMPFDAEPPIGAVVPGAPIQAVDERGLVMPPYGGVVARPLGPPGGFDGLGTLAAQSANGAGGQRPTVTVPVGTTIADAERALILETLRYCDGAKERTADMLGISLKTLYNRLRAYEGG